jgi:hypothetical protein
MAMLSKTYRFNSASTKSQVISLQKLIPYFNIHTVLKELRIAKTILEKKEKVLDPYFLVSNFTKK